MAAIEEDPSGISDADRLRFRGEALLGMRDGPTAEQNYREWLDLQPGSSDATVGYAKSRALQGDFVGASDALNVVIQRNTEHTDAWLALAVLQYGQSNHGAAKLAYERAIASSMPQTNVQRYVFALVGLADTELMLRDIDAARLTVDQLRKYMPKAPHTLLQQARLAQLEKNDLASETALQELVAIAPDNVQALMLLGSVQWRLSYFQQAEISLSRAISLAPDNLQARKMWALIQLRRSNTSEAVDILQPLLDGQSDDAELFGMLAVAHLQRGQSESALDTLLLTAQRYPNNVDAQLQLAEGYRYTGNPEKAIDMLRELRASEDDEFRRERILIASHVDLGETEPAFEVANAVLGSGTRNVDILNFIGEMYASRGRVDLGRTVLEKSRAIAPNEVKTLLALAALEERDNRSDQAKHYYQAVVDIEPTSLEAMIGLAQLASAAGDDAEAASYLDRAREQHPEEVPMRLTLAIRHFNDGRYREARALAREIARIGSDSPLVNRSIGRILLDTGALEEAQAQFELANRLAPESVEIMIGLAQSLIARGDPQRAYDVLQRALTLEPESIGANSVMTLAELRLGLVENATARSAKLRSREPDHVSALVVEGEVHYALGDYDKAATAFQSATRKGAGERAAIREFQARVVRQSDPDPTRPLLDWIAEHPDDVRAKSRLAQYYGETGESDKAVRLYQELLKTNANDPVILNNLAWEYQKGGNFEAALGLAVKARELRPESAAIADTLGWIYRGLGERDKSLQLLREAVRLMPKDPEIRYHLAVTLAESGVDAEAAEILADIIDSGREFASRDAALALQAEM